jgi:putrescine importer
MSEVSGDSGVKLRRVLSLSDLVIYGIILIQPVAPMALFGFANRDSGGHAVTAILCAMIAIIFTAISYGRMANHYPAAGSAYTYVGRGLNPHLGFLAGFTMFLDYLIVPVICTLYCGIAANHLLPAVPTRAWFILFACGFTWLNLRGIKATARVNMGLMIGMSVVVFWYMGAAVWHIYHGTGFNGLFTTEPFYHSSTFDWAVIFRGTALAALTYIGFDGLTTLSEEVDNPRRNILLATVMTCLITGVWSSMQIYLAQAAVPWHEWEGFLRDMAVKFGPENAIDKAMIGVGNLVGGRALEETIAMTLLVACIGSGVTGMTGSSRILYGMGRDRVLPGRFFAHLSKNTRVPSKNLLLIGGLSLIGANLLTYDQCAHLINFGAFLAFMLVNAASIREYFFRAEKKSIGSFFKNFLPPAVGLIACFIIWINLPPQTFMIGCSWLSVGAIYLVVRTRGFRRKLEVQDVF